MNENLNENLNIILELVIDGIKYYIDDAKNVYIKPDMNYRQIENMNVLERFERLLSIPSSDMYLGDK